MATNRDDAALLMDIKSTLSDEDLYQYDDQYDNTSIPLFQNYTEENVNEVCVNLAGELFKTWARPSLRQFNPLLPEITKSNANNTKKTIYNKIKKVMRENPNTGFIPVLEVKKKLIDQWGSLIHRNAANSFVTPSSVSNSNDPTITKNLSAPPHNPATMMMSMPPMQAAG
ncbi:hypothetical protein TrRE_jg12518 [Triparma retinervis]|uniref:Uncharacterized protein n=1 Tax=Triparma retinervis TaxID=2557542 RepID=A0A9W6Z7V6_9STRA|nr:hypothetical protein TrRE_jg12518 [Triparma retinervis]